MFTLRASPLHALTGVCNTCNPYYAFEKWGVPPQSQSSSCHSLSCINHRHVPLRYQVYPLRVSPHHAPVGSVQLHCVETCLVPLVWLPSMASLQYMYTATSLILIRGPVHYALVLKTESCCDANFLLMTTWGATSAIQTSFEPCAVHGIYPWHSIIYPCIENYSGTGKHIKRSFCHLGDHPYLLRYQQIMLNRYLEPESFYTRITFIVEFSFIHSHAEWTWYCDDLHSRNVISI